MPKLLDGILNGDIMCCVSDVHEYPVGFKWLWYVAVHKQKHGSKPPHDYLLMLSMDLATFVAFETQMELSKMAGNSAS